MRPSSTSTTACDDRHLARPAPGRGPAASARCTRPRPHGPAAAGCPASARPCASSRPDASVARQVARGGQHQVAQARQAHEGLGAGAQRHAQARHLGQAAGDQRGACVQPRAVGLAIVRRQAIDEAGGDGQHVLHRTADLHADRVGRAVDAQRVAVEGLHRRLAQCRVAAGGHQRRRLLACHLQRKARARQHAGRRAWPQVTRDLVAQCAAAGFEALAQPQRRHVRWQRGQTFAQRRHRRGDDQQPVLRMAQRGVVVGADAQRRGQRQLGQVALVAALRVHLHSLLHVARPQQHIVALRRCHGQRRAPGTRAEHADVHAAPGLGRRGARLS